MRKNKITAWLLCVCMLAAGSSVSAEPVKKTETAEE